MKTYKIGDSDQRPWGSYIVTGLGMNEHGEEYCDKDIKIHPQAVLSLQSHNLRRERWTVKSGELTVLLDGAILTLSASQSIDIPLGGIHTMANLANAPVIVSERQEGVCREEDIIRYADQYGRASAQAPLDNERVSVSLAAYGSLLKKAKKG